MAYEDITKQLSTTTDEIHTADIDVEKRAAMYGAPASENLAFTKACFAFRDGLDSKRRGTGDIKETVVAAVEEVDNLEPPVPLSETLRQEKRERQIRILRAVHHTLTAILSLVVAVFQGMTYTSYEKTKDVPGAWPKQPTLFPTLLLFAVAICALLFDVCLLIAYFLPEKSIAQKAFKFATSLHWFIIGLKGLSWTMAASVCRTGFSMSGGNDLWSWSCSSQADAMQSVNNASWNCTSNTAAWILAIINIGLEGLNILITMLVARQGDAADKTAATPTSSDSSQKSPNSASKLLLDRNKLLEKRAEEIDGELSAITPDTKTFQDM